MRNINKILAVFVLSLSIAACNETGTGDVENNVSFTALEWNDDIAALDHCEYVTASFTVEATGKWKVVSDEPSWVEFSKDNELFFPDVQGGEGSEPVYVRISNAARDFSESTANIRIIYDDKEECVAVVVRPAKEYEFSMETEDGDVIESIEIDCSGSSFVRFNANFDYVIIDYPEWLTEPVFDTDKNGYSLEVVEGSLPFMSNGTFVIGNSNGSVKRDILISYVGMDPKAIRINVEGSPWGWDVSVDGKTFEKESSSMTDGSDKIVVENMLPVNVLCRNYDYRLFCIEDIEGIISFMEGESAWIKCVRSSSNAQELSVSVDQFKSTFKKMYRSGYLFAVPEAVCDSFTNSLNSLDSINALLDLFADNVVVNVTQNDDAGDCIVLDNEGNMSSSVTEEEHYEYIASEFSIEDVVACEIVPGRTYDINTKITATGSKFCLHELKGGGCPIIDNYVEDWNMGMKKKDGYYHLTFTVPASFDKNVIVRFYQGMNINFKALIMRIKK